MAIEEHSIKKRYREDESELDLPEVKKLRDDLLGVFDESGPDSTIQDLDSVMKSFEEEIPASSSSPVIIVDLTSDSSESQPELGYLLEASDDELGLPPSSVNSSGEDAKNELVILDWVESGQVNDGFWGFEDHMPSYDSFDMGIVDIYNTDYAAFDGGLFEHSNVCFDSSDYPEYSLRPGTLPAE